MIKDSVTIYAWDEEYGLTKAKINMEIRTEDGIKKRWDTLEEVENVEVLSLMGEVIECRYGICRWCCSGQTYEEIRKATGDADGVQRLIKIWERWHLNDMKMGTEKQYRVLEEAGIEGDFEKRKQYLREHDLINDRGITFGEAWLYAPLPDDVREWLIEWFKEHDKIFIPRWADDGARD